MKFNPSTTGKGFLFGFATILFASMVGCHDPVEDTELILQAEMESTWKDPVRRGALEQAIENRVQRFLRREAENACGDFTVQNISLGSIQSKVEVYSVQWKETDQERILTIDCFVHLPPDIGRVIEFEDVLRVFADIRYRIDGFQIARRGLVQIIDPKNGDPIEVSLQGILEARAENGEGDAPVNQLEFEEALDTMRGADGVHRVLIARRVTKGRVNRLQSWAMCDRPTDADFSACVGLYLETVIEKTFSSAFEVLNEN